jgi:hypothetical protein
MNDSHLAFVSEKIDQLEKDAVHLFHSWKSTDRAAYADTLYLKGYIDSCKVSEASLEDDQFDEVEQTIIALKQLLTEACEILSAIQEEAKKSKKK